MTTLTESIGKGNGNNDVGGQTGATAVRHSAQYIVSGVPVCEEGLRLLVLNVLHRNIVGIRAWEEPTKAPGTILGRSDGDQKGRGLLRSPV